MGIVLCVGHDIEKQQLRRAKLSRDGFAVLCAPPQQALAWVGDVLFAYVMVGTEVSAEEFAALQRLVNYPVFRLEPHPQEEGKTTFTECLVA